MDSQQTTRGNDRLQNPTVIYSAQSVQQAHFLKNLLAERGIAARVTNDVLTGGSGVDLVGLPTASKVLVAEQDAKAARQFAIEFDRRSVEMAGAAGTEVESEAGETANWPLCPQCNARRSTRCPVCQTAGTDFTEADADFLGSLGSVDSSGTEESAAAGSCGCGSPQCGDAAPLGGEECGQLESAAAGPPETAAGEMAGRGPALMCSTCDEPFVAEFPRRCEWCGHEFADGYDAEAVTEREPIPIRAMVLVCLLTGIALLATIYFMWLV